jgi:hypothetical protein
LMLVVNFTLQYYNLPIITEKGLLSKDLISQGAAC